MKKKLIYIGVIVLGLLVIDQITKLCAIGINGNIQVINGILQFTYVENTGGAFSLGQNNLIGIIITNVIILGIMIRFVITQFDNMDIGTRISVSLIIAGGISNFADRIIRGHVIDFIDITPMITFPIFNIADIYIVIGWLLFVILTIKYAIGNKKALKSE